MPGLRASDLLDVWERGLAQIPLGRAASLLAAAFPESTTEELERMSVGRRDALLLSLRERTFGSSVHAVTSCSACHAAVELNFQMDDVRAGQPAADHQLEMNIGEYMLRLRLPTCGDLTRVMSLALAEDERAAEALFSCCLVAAARDGTPVDAGGLPLEVIDQAIAGLAQADPQADVRLAIECPECGTRARVPFDIVSFFWREIEDLCIRTLREVHALASAYGWTEDQILALSPLRRRCYLEMVGA